MYTFITFLIISICILLTAIVLIQNPKGGGLSASFSGTGQQIFGASRANDIVEKTTWTLGVLMLVFSLFSSVFIGKI
jgi:preprotein translocase subunit SecG